METPNQASARGLIFRRHRHPLGCMVGFRVGFQINEWGWGEQSSKVVGVLVVGLAYAVMVVLVRLAWFAIKRRRRQEIPHRVV